MAIIPVLGAIGDERAVPSLIDALNDRDDHWLGREAAAFALGNIGDRQAVPYLINAAWMADTRDAAIRALASMPDARAIDAFVSCLNAEELAPTRERAMEGLISLGGESVPALVAVLEMRTDEGAATHEQMLSAQLLGTIGDSSARESLLQLLDDPDQALRRTAGEALARIASD